MNRKTLTKCMLREYKWKFDGRNKIQINGRITINVDVSVENVMYVEKIMFGILLHVAVKVENI